MSFLFGKKNKEGKDSKESKGQTALPQRPAEPPSGVGSNASIPPVNGARSKERGVGVISPPPGALANKSANPTEDPMVPSPEQKQGLRGRLDSDLQVRFDCTTYFVNWRRRYITLQRRKIIAFAGTSLTIDIIARSKTCANWAPARCPTCGAVSVVSASSHLYIFTAKSIS